MLLAACGDAPELEPWPADLPENPEDGAHFDGQRDPFYEGWYHKISLPDSDEAFFFIYSVVNPLPGGSSSTTLQHMPESRWAWTTEPTAGIHESPYDV